jgi:hypothetical protein
MPIQIEFIGRRLQWERLDRLADGGALRNDDHLRMGNFSATAVRFVLPSARPPTLSPHRSLHPRSMTAPMAALALPPAGRPMLIVPPVNAIDVSPIASAAEMKDFSATIDDTLNLAEIQHPASETARNSATAWDSCDNVFVGRVHPRRPGARS